MDIRIHHVTGELSVGEDIVYIVVAGAHREEVFKTLRDAVERMKREVAIWKKEITDEGEYWVSEKQPQPPLRWKNRDHIATPQFLIEEGRRIFRGPFVGAAGKFLDQLLAEAGLSRSRIYITNVVKCFLPENRATEDQVKSCHSIPRSAD